MASNDTNLFNTALGSVRVTYGNTYMNVGPIYSDILRVTESNDTICGCVDSGTIS